MSGQSPEFKRCLAMNKLIYVDKVSRLVGKELNVAQEDLAEAQAGLERGSFKWVIIQAYYSMFHAARALVYTHGYREKSHYCLSVALRELFVRQGYLDEEYILELEDTRGLREDADYRASFSEASARQALQAAKRFLRRAQELLA